MDRKTLKEKLTSILDRKDYFDKYISINSKLNRVGQSMVILGGILVIYNLISTILTIATNAGLRFVPILFWDVFFSKQGENIIFYVLTILGLIGLVVGTILLLIYKTRKTEIQSKLFVEYRELDSLAFTPMYQVNDMYVFDMMSEDIFAQIDEFIGSESSEAQKLAKIFSRVNNKTGIKQIEKSIAKYTGHTVKITQVIPRNSPHIIGVENGVLECYIVDANQTKHLIDIHKMRKDGVLEKRNN